MEHDLNAFMIQSYLKHSAGTLTSPVSVDTVVPSQVMHSVQASFVLVKTCLEICVEFVMGVIRMVAPGCIIEAEVHGSVGFIYTEPKDIKLFTYICT